MFDTARAIPLVEDFAMDITSIRNKEQVQWCGRQVCLISLVLVTNVIVGTFSPVLQAQVARFAPLKKGSASVSVRELTIPIKARNEFQRAMKKLEKRDEKGSLRHFDAATQLYPEYYEAHYYEGVAQLNMRKDDQALEAFQKAIDLSGGHYARAQFGYALILCRRGKPEEAERAVRFGLQTDPNISEGHLILGLALLKLHRVDEAAESAHEALRLNDPSSTKALLILADAEADKGNYEAQVRYLDTYMRLRPHDPNKALLLSVRDAAKRLEVNSRSVSKR
jgi:tetratricopeptide (TPR) repeat protein